MAAATDPIVAIVDDQPDNRSMYAECLDEYTIRTAGSGQEALDVVDCEVDVVLLDRRMSDLSGDDVVHRLRAREINTIVAMCTAVAPSVDLVDLPVDDYLIKPVKFAELRDTIESMFLRADYNRTMQRILAIA